MASDPGDIAVFADRARAGEVLKKVAARIGELLKKQFGFDGGDEAAAKNCPGEENCSSFKVALSECGDGNEACIGCQWLSTKPKKKSISVDEQTKTGDSIDDFISRILWLRGEQLTGGLDLSEILEIEYHALVLFNFKYEQFSQQSDLMQRKLLEKILEWQPVIAGARIGGK